MNSTTNNTQQQVEGQSAADSHHQNESCEESNNNSFSERKPKPIRGIGFGDIFAAGATKPKSASSTSSIDATKSTVGGVVASERLNTGGGSILAGSLQKSVPRKPPPPTPTGGNHESNPQNGSITSTSDQAPALPPKPSNQSFSPFMQQPRSVCCPPQSAALPSQRGQAREQARVIHAYEPSNDDELELKVNDIINVIDKKSEDHGWWKGELNGKVGVFPDNFVQLISNVQGQMPMQSSPFSMANQSEWPNGRSGAGMSSTGATASGMFSSSQQQQQQQQQHASSTESKTKSVFSSTPKGFTKGLESDLEKHNNNPASFLSLKRNKITGLSNMSNNETGSTNVTNSQMNMGFMSLGSNSSNQNGHHVSNSQDANSPNKLNHITANRAKGPSRRPPSNVLNRRNQAGSDGGHCVSLPVKKEAHSDDIPKEEQSPMIGLPTAGSMTPTANSRHDTLPSTPSEPPSFDRKQQSAHAVGPVTSGSFNGSPSSNQNGVSARSNDNSSSSNRPNSINNQVDNQQLFGGALAMAAPKLSQQMNFQDNGANRGGQKTPTSATGSPPTSTPPWMVNLRKTNAEKKREPGAPVSQTSTPATPVLHTSAATSPQATVSTQSTAPPTPPSPVSAYPHVKYPLTDAIDNNSGQNNVNSIPPNEPLSNGQRKDVKDNEHSKSNNAADKVVAASLVSETQLHESMAKVENLLKQISKDMTSELSEVRKDVRQLQEDVRSINGLKVVIDGIKTELKACQSATESQRKYIKELVNNLADERKKIATMQVELDRNLK